MSAGDRKDKQGTKRTRDDSTNDLQPSDKSKRLKPDEDAHAKARKKYKRRGVTWLVVCSCTVHPEIDGTRLMDPSFFSFACGPDGELLELLTVCCRVRQHDVYRHSDHSESCASAQHVSPASHMSFCSLATSSMTAAQRTS